MLQGHVFVHSVYMGQNFEDKVVGWLIIEVCLQGLSRGSLANLHVFHLCQESLVAEVNFVDN